MRLGDVVIREQEELLSLAQETLDQHVEAVKFFREQAATASDPQETEQAARIADEMEGKTAMLEQYRNSLVDYLQELKRRFSND